MGYGTGHTSGYGIPIYPGDFDEWGMYGGMLDSPSNMADRVAAKFDGRLTEIERRIDMTGVPSMSKSSTVGDVKKGFNLMRARLAGRTLAVVAAALSSAFSFGASLSVHKANLNDLGDDMVVTNVSVSGDFSHSATSLTEKAEFFDGIRTNLEASASAAFSNAVDSVVAKVAPAAVHSTSPGSFSPVVLSSDGSNVVKVSESPGGLQAVETVRVLRVGDLTDVWLGGTETNGTVTGGETAYGMMMSAVSSGVKSEMESAVPAAVSSLVYVTNSATSGSFVGTVVSGSSSYPLYAPHGTSVTRHLTSGTEIATITVGPDSSTLYAPSTPEYLGTEGLHIDRNLELYSSDQWNTVEWDVYAEHTEKYLQGTPVPSVLSTNFVFTLTKTNIGTSVSADYEWRINGTNGMSYVDVPLHPMKCYETAFTRMKPFGSSLVMAHYSKMYPYSTVGYVYILESNDATADVIRDPSLTEYVVGSENGTNLLQKSRYVAFRRQPYFVNEGRVASAMSVSDAIGRAAGDIGKSRAEIRGSGSSSNTVIRYDGYASRSYFDSVTNGASIRNTYNHAETGTDDQTGKAVNANDLYLHPFEYNSWTGAVRVTDNRYGSGGTYYHTSVIRKNDDGSYYALCQRPSYKTRESTGLYYENPDGRVDVQVYYMSGIVKVLGYVTFRPGPDSPTVVVGNKETVVEDRVAFSNSLSSVAFTGLTATNETSGTTVAIEPYTVDGSTILWRVK